MTTDQLINNAKHALRTGQPNLANLYMRKARQQIADERKQNATEYYAARALLRSQQMSKDLNGFIQGLAEIIGDAFKPITDAYRPMTDALESIRYATRSDYALAGPAKGQTS